MQKMSIKIDFQKEPLDKEIFERLQSHRIWISESAPPLTKEKALVLIGQRMLDEFVKDFVNLWKRELFPHVCIRDYEATEKDWQKWLGSDYKGSKYCKEVDDKMDARMKVRLNSYLDLLEEISEKTGNESTAVALLQEISKDRRMEKIKHEQDSRNGEMPATEKQKKFMEDLNIEFADDITRKQASFLIENERGDTD